MATDTTPIQKATPAFWCVNTEFHCGRRVPVSQGNQRLRICSGCLSTASRRWSVAAADVDKLEVAINCARSGKMGKDGTYEEVWALLTQMGVQKHTWVPPTPKHMPPQGQVPASEREDQEGFPF